MSNSRDVVFAFFGTAWSGAVNRDFVMPEDRLAAALLEHPDVPRVLVCSPYRSIVGRTRAALGRGHTPEAPFPRAPTGGITSRFGSGAATRSTLGAASPATSAGSAPPRSGWGSRRRR